MFSWIEIFPICNKLLNAIIIVFELGVLGALVPLAMVFVFIVIREMAYLIESYNKQEEQDDEN